MGSKLFYWERTSPDRDRLSRTVAAHCFGLGLVGWTCVLVPVFAAAALGVYVGETFLAVRGARDAFRAFMFFQAGLVVRYSALAHVFTVPPAGRCQARDCITQTVPPSVARAQQRAACGVRRAACGRSRHGKSKAQCGG